MNTQAKLQQKLIKTLEFVTDTNEILMQLIRYKQSGNATKSQIEAELFKFRQLAESGKQDGIENMDLFYNQGRLMVETLKLFTDVMPELKELK